MKKLALILVVAAMLLSLTACGTSSLTFTTGSETGN